MTSINACRESQKRPHGPHASLNPIVAFHYRKMAAQETRNRKDSDFYSMTLKVTFFLKKTSRSSSKTVNLFRRLRHDETRCPRRRSWTSKCMWSPRIAKLFVMFWAKETIFLHVHTSSYIVTGRAWIYRAPSDVVH